MGKYTSRACQDTEGFRAWKRELLIAVIAGILSWLFLPEQEAVSEITAIVIAIIAAILIAPVLEFCWNLACSPYRIERDKNALLESQVLQYQSSQGIETVKLSRQTVKGRWYGAKFILDKPIPGINITSHYKGEDYSPDNPDSDPFDCPPNTLVIFKIDLHPNVNLRLRQAGSNSDYYEMNRSGIIEVPVDSKSSIEYFVIGRGDLSFTILGWTKAGA